MTEQVIFQATIIENDDGTLTLKVVGKDIPDTVMVMSGLDALLELGEEFLPTVLSVVSPVPNSVSDLE